MFQQLVTIYVYDMNQRLIDEIVKTHLEGGKYDYPKGQYLKERHTMLGLLIEV